MFKIFLTKSILSIIPFLFISYFTRFDIENVNIWCAFGLQIGAIFGIILGKYIHQYGKKNAIIFGSILFIVFSSQFFINKSINISIIILILSGFGYGIICYEIFYGVEQNKIKIYTKKQVMIFYIIFIWFYVNIGIVLIANSLKISKLYNSVNILIFFIFYIIIAFSIEKHKLFFKSGKIDKYFLLIIIGFWISCISSDIIILTIGSIFIAISYAVISQYRKEIFNNNSAINLQMLTGYVIAGIIIMLTKNIININYFYYVSFVSGAILATLYKPLLNLV